MKISKVFNGQRLREARVCRGKSITDLANEISITKQSISLFENGKSQPSLETLLQLMNTLQFPREYFYEYDSDKIEIGNTYFRALLSTNKKDQLMQIEKTKILSKIYQFLESYIAFPDLNIPTVNEFESIENVVEEVRSYWNLGDEPINNLVRVMERNGIKITEFPVNDLKIDAFSQRQQINDVDHFFVVLSNDKKSATRRQFDAAHELGHIILHDWSVDINSVNREEFRDIEKEANEFAAALLLPKEHFLKDLIYPNKLDYYKELKKKWKVSISAMIVRAYKLNAINNNQYQYLMRQISKRRWRTKEPLDDVLQPSKPIIFRKALEVLISNDILSKGEFVKKLAKEKVSLHPEDIEIILGLENGFLRENKIEKDDNILNLKR